MDGEVPRVFFHARFSINKTIRKLRDQLESTGLSPVADDPLKVVGKENT